MQDIDFAGQYLQAVEVVVDEVGEEIEEPEEQKSMRRKKRIEMFQEEVWGVFLEGRVENPFKKKLEKGTIHGYVPARPSNVPDPGVIEGSYPGMPFLPVQNDASGGVGACVGTAAVSGGVTAPVLVSPLSANIAWYLC